MSLHAAGECRILACFPHRLGQARGALLAQSPPSVITVDVPTAPVSDGVVLLTFRKEAAFPFRKTGTQRGKEPRVK